jgi:parallel beta-helix repeat protein
MVPDQFKSIQSAMEAAKAGDTIKVGAGVYNESLQFSNGVNLIGEGKDVVRVRYAGTAHVLLCDGIKTGFISGLTFEHTSKTDGPTNRRPCVAWLENGTAVEITDCRFQMANGSGLFITNCSPKITECLFQDNGLNGITVSSNSNPVIFHNHCLGNTGCGIAFLLNAAGHAENNACENNKHMGIVVSGFGTSPVLKANQCRGNELSGIIFSRGASGKAENNTCENNKQAGIVATDAATAPILKSNHCLDNTFGGICFQKGAGGEADDNVCEGNQGDGILVLEANTNPHIEANTCRNNRYGIFCTADATPKLGNNLLEGNKMGTLVTNGK